MEQFDPQMVKKIQAVDLRMAKFFVEFCNQNNLLCYFCGGGCIGAVRHKGFIPWDDDLDFFMPRADYEKLKGLWTDTEEYALLYPTENYIDHNIFATLRDKNTTMIKPYQKDLDTVHGICIDIFPIDGYPDKSYSRKKQVFWGLIYQLFCAQVIPENHGKAVAIAAKIILTVFKGKKIRYRIWKKAEKEMSKYKIEECDNITEICAGPGYFRNKYPRWIFEKATFLDFEDTKMPVPYGYDRYLRIVFGDYMKLPPEDKRFPQHDALVIDTEKSYLAYKGLYYCKDV